MKNNKMRKLYVFHILWVILLLFILLMVAVFSSGCKITEKIDKSRQYSDSLRIENLSKSVYDLQKSNSELLSVIKEMKSKSISFEDCDTTIVNQILKSGYDSSTVQKLFDIVFKQRDEIEYLSDGTIKIKGKLKNITEVSNRLDSSLKIEKQENQKLKSENSELKSELIKKSIDKLKDIKTEIKYPWYLLILGIFAGCLIWEYLGLFIKTKIQYAIRFFKNK